MYNEIPEDKRLIDLTVKEFKQVMGNPAPEKKEVILTTQQLMERLQVDNKKSIYNWTHEGMREAKLGKNRWDWEKVRQFFKDRYGNKKKYIWDQK